MWAISPSCVITFVNKIQKDTSILTISSDPLPTLCRGISKNRTKKYILQSELVMITNKLSINKYWRESSGNSNTQCKFYNRPNGCRFGDKCRYKHEILRQHYSVGVEIEQGNGKEQILQNSAIYDVGVLLDCDKIKSAQGTPHDQKQSCVILKTKQNVKYPVCCYFQRSGSCPDGEMCRFSHQIDMAKSKQGLNNIHKSEKRPLGKSCVELEASDENFNVAEQHLNEAKPIKRPEHLSEKLSELTNEEATYLQAVEIEQLRKRFRNSNLKITHQDHATICMFTMKPTDPDWVRNPVTVMICPIFGCFLGIINFLVTNMQTLYTVKVFKILRFLNCGSRAHRLCMLQRHAQNIN